MRRLFLLLSLGLVLLCTASYVPVSLGHNITKILAQHPDFSTFNHYLTLTHLAGEINRRETVTVLAVSNADMSSLLSKHLSLYTLKNVLSLHVLVDYFGAKKLHQLTGGSALTSTLFQATGAAPGTSGFVNISDHRAGKVTFSAATDDSTTDADAPPAAAASFVKSIKEIPYNISVVQISSPLSSPAAEAPTPAPAQVNLTDLMAKKGCRTFAGLLTSTAGADKTFADSVAGGLSVFCPIDQAMDAFLPKFKNLTADAKLSLLLYHGFPVYYSIQMLKSGNGVVNTLATDGGAKDYNVTVQNEGEVVTLRTSVSKAKITGTLLDEDPLAVYTIDHVLEPRELFKLVEAPAPAPEAEAPAAEAPKKAGKGKGKGKRHAASPPAPAGPEGEPADQQAADDNAGGRTGVGLWAAAVAMVVAVVVAA